MPAMCDPLAAPGRRKNISRELGSTRQGSETDVIVFTKITSFDNVSDVVFTVGRQ